MLERCRDDNDDDPDNNTRWIREFFLSSLAVLAEGENEGGRCAGKERIDRRVLYILRFSVRKK